jgi:UrcA family protein
LNELTTSLETIMKALSTSIRLPNLIAAAIFGTFALTCGAPSMAADSEDVRQVVVKYGDLTVSNPQGATALYNRIRAAANGVCNADDYGSRDLGSRVSADACVRKAISGAVTTVGRAELFAIYNAKNVQPRGIPVAAAQTR